MRTKKAGPPDVSREMADASRRAAAVATVAMCWFVLVAGCAAIGDIASGPAAGGAGGSVTRPISVEGIAGRDGRGAITAPSGSVGAGPVTGHHDPDAPVCGFAVPSARSTGLPNPISYDTTDARVVVDLVTGLVWDRTPADVSMSVVEASTYCAASLVAGHSDWRLPSITELASIMDAGTAQPAAQVDPTAFPGTVAAPFWTSQPLAGASVREHWFVNFSLPQVSFAMGDIFANQVRCVRTGTSPAPLCASRGSRYRDSGAVVVDATTGLSWQRLVDARAVTFDDAKASCATLGERYRLPTIQELLTIVDYSVAQQTTATAPMIDAAAFPETPAESFWASPSPLSDAGLPYTVNFGNGLVVGQPRGASAIAPPLAHARCVE